MTKHNSLTLQGRPASAGKVTGHVRIINNRSDLKLIEPGEIVIAEQTEPSYGPYLRRAGAIVTERGGRTCHCAIYARERGIPAVVGVADIMKILSGYSTVQVDGGQGIVIAGEAC
jgi:pyruvate, water dikinase